MKVSVGMTGGFPIVMGLHQATVLSPYIFDLVMDVFVEDVKMVAPWIMLFADDIVLCYPAREQLKQSIEEWRRTLEEKDMRMSQMKME